MKNKRRLRKYFIWLRFILIFLLTVLLVGYLYKTISSSERFFVKEIEYSGIVKFVNKTDFEAVVQTQVLNKNVFFLNPHLLENSLKTSFQGVRSIKIIKKYPNKLVISVLERVPAAVVTDKNGIRYLSDNQGYILGLTDEGYYDLPTVNLQQELFVGSTIESQVVPLVLDVIKYAEIEEVSVTSLSFKPRYVEFYAQDGTNVLFSNDKPVAGGMQIVSRILMQSRLENKSVDKIDLRYDKVIVLYGGDSR